MGDSLSFGCATLVLLWLPPVDVVSQVIEATVNHWKELIDLYCLIIFDHIKTIVVNVSAMYISWLFESVEGLHSLDIHSRYDL